MSIILNILLSLFIFSLNLPSPIKINSFTPSYITSNEVLFEFEYKSENKADIICFFKPYLNEQVKGKISLSTNLTTFQNPNMTGKVYINEFMFNTPYSLVINSSNAFNEGKNNYYIYLVGNLACSFEIFLINEIKNISIKDFYFYSYFKDYSSQNYLSFKIENFTENIYMNILLFNKSCSSIEIKKGSNLIKCDKEFKDLLLLEKNNNYLIKYNLDIINYLAINFQNELIPSLNDKNQSFIPLSNSIFNFSINIQDYKIDDYFGFVIDQPIKCTLEGDYSSENNINEKFKPNMKAIIYHY